MKSDGATRAKPGLPRGLQLCMALALLTVASPLLVAASMAILTTSKGPVLFRQTRVGRHGDTFTILKLRTMVKTGSGDSITAAGDQRITPVGRLLRRFKIDELPQLWNVIRGDMVLVGPRPEVPQFVQEDQPIWQEILASPPGITDPASVALRHEEEILKRAEDPVTHYRDVVLPLKLSRSADYLKRRTAWTDLGVLAQTALVPLGLGPAPIRISDLK